LDQVASFYAHPTKERLMESYAVYPAFPASNSCKPSLRQIAFHPQAPCVAVMIDDLDRLELRKSVEILHAISQFGGCKHILFIVSLNTDHFRKEIKNSLKVDDKMAEEIVEKACPYLYRISQPNLYNKKHQEYVEEIKWELAILDADTEKALINFLGGQKRKVKSFINELQFLYIRFCRLVFERCNAQIRSFVRCTENGECKSTLKCKASFRGRDAPIVGKALIVAYILKIRNVEVNRFLTRYDRSKQSNFIYDLLAKVKGNSTQLNLDQDERDLINSIFPEPITRTDSTLNELMELILEIL